MEATESLKPRQPERPSVLNMHSLPWLCSCIPKVHSIVFFPPFVAASLPTMLRHSHACGTDSLRGVSREAKPEPLQSLHNRPLLISNGFGIDNGRGDELRYSTHRDGWSRVDAVSVEYRECFRASSTVENFGEHARHGILMARTCHNFPP